VVSVCDFWHSELSNSLARILSLVARFTEATRGETDGSFPLLKGKLIRKIELSGSAWEDNRKRRRPTIDALLRLGMIQQGFNSRGGAAVCYPVAPGALRQSRCLQERTPSALGATKMKPRITVLTLGVSDLEASLAFYRDGMGLPTKGIVGEEFQDGAVAFLNLNDGLMLALYPTVSLSKDARITATKARLGAVSIGHAVKSKVEVDAVMKQAEAAGARITDPAHDRFWGGYSGYFHDPDGHLWEIAWNPAWELKE
jgi:uncharacterized protein